MASLGRGKMPNEFDLGPGNRLATGGICAAVVARSARVWAERLFQHSEGGAEELMLA